MLEPDQRRLLTDALRPPDGYTLDEAIGCTYSLDLIALAGVPLACMSLDPTLLKADEAGSAIAALECVRRHAERFTVFCQAGQIHVPRQVQLLLGYLEDSVHQVQAPRGGVFHPKLFAGVARGSALKMFPWAYAFVDRGQVTGEHFRGAWDNIGTPEQLAALDRRLKP